MLIDELNWRTFSIMCNAISHQHIEFVFIILDRQHHCHRLTDLHNAADFRGPWTFSDLNLHPTLEIVTQEVGGNSVKHVNLEWTEGDSLFVEIVPCASEFTGLRKE